MANVLGINCKLFRGDAGALATSEMRNVKDAKLSIEAGSADATTRAAEGWEVEEVGLFKAELTWKMQYDTDDADFVAIMDAFFSKSAIAIFASTGDGKGLDADFKIFKLEQDQSMRETVVMDIVARPTRSLRAPRVI